MCLCPRVPMPARRLSAGFIADPESVKRVVALLLAPVVFQLALVLVPPRSAPRLSPAYRRRVRNARWAARITQPERPRAFDPKSAPIFDPTRGGFVRLGRHLMPGASGPGVYLEARQPHAQVD